MEAYLSLNRHLDELRTQIDQLANENSHHKVSLSAHNVTNSFRTVQQDIFFGWSLIPVTLWHFGIQWHQLVLRESRIVTSVALNFCFAFTGSSSAQK